jgi:2-oxoglutarate dehydrogenase E2 component (dihydrolipoamide succinyltransferase)
MKREIKAPTVGESITEVRILSWSKPDGAAVKVGDQILEIESDKATVEVVAEYAGVLRHGQPAGATVTIGAVIGHIEEGAAGSVSASAPATAAKPAPSAPIATSVAAPMAAVSHTTSTDLSPAVRRMVTEQNLNPASIPGTGLGGRITTEDVVNFVERGGAAAPRPAATGTGAVAAGAPSITPAVAPGAAPASTPTAPMKLDARDRRVPMSLLRKKIAERLVMAQHNAAILTTFNEVDLAEVNAMRAQHKDAFKAKHGVGLGYMSFFSRAVVEAMREVPAVNYTIDGSDIIQRDYVDLGIAVGTPRGLVVPVIRDAQNMGFLEIEKTIADFAARGKVGKLTMKELSGGTFTISNGGTYGSLLSTPILNPPQSGILGMHKIMDRPVAVNGQVVIRPMMYVALSYDHRLIDGKEAVTFLVKMKEFLENPSKLNLNY